MNFSFKLFLILVSAGSVIAFLLFVILSKRIVPEYRYLFPLVISVVALVTSLIATFKNELFPLSIRVIPGDLTFAVQANPTHRSVALIFALSFINEGYGHGVVEWPALKVKGQGKVKLYTPIAEIDYERFLQGKRRLHAENVQSAFSPFALGGREAIKKYVLFSQEVQNKKYPFSEWTPGDYEFEIYVKTADKKEPQLVGVIKHEISQSLLESYFAGSSTVLMQYDVDI